MLTRPLKILAAIEGYLPEIVGGSNNYLQQMAVYFGSEGHRITILTPTYSDKLAEYESDGNIEIIRYKISFKQHNILRYLIRSGAEKTYDKFLYNRYFDVISLHSPHIGAGIKNSFSKKFIPFVYHYQSPHHEEEEILKRSISYSIFNPKKYLKYLWSPYSIREMRRTERECVEYADLVIVLSQWMKSKLSYIHNIPESRISIVPGSVDTKRFYPPENKYEVRKELGLPTNRPVILTVRRLVPRMGIDILIQSIRRVADKFNDICLVIGGEGYLMNELKSLVNKLGLNNNVYFQGFIKNELLHKYYQASDLFVLPTTELEGFGLVTLEALAAGTPVIGTNAGATPEILNKIDPELVVPAGDSVAMSDRIIRFFASSWWQKQIQQNCRLTIQRNYSRDLILNRLMFLYSRIAEPWELVNINNSAENTYKFANLNNKT
ncbi:MAG: hypothetical protein A2161_08230 [Candidatus Schekmanbacteria bacterium RBG_13_48_7]|uniref:Glycosyl transferase family 1 domain-containing protein n=1 Tax=Candidatus Schekmanbacteria bacterium RBG_13_48_7 TaxID=1817878 RepID=A0A1F7RIU2_9BACT|nr:MAG: hypothetical protein A2161_08230 [Candidatus Schekmanbacteria bacterium RBG_13_48_7]